MASSPINDSEPLDYNTWLIGISLLIVALVLSSFMGLYQQILYSKYGKVWKEGLFYMHFFSLPGFLFFRNNIIKDYYRYSGISHDKIFRIRISKRVRIQDSFSMGTFDLEYFHSMYLILQSSIGICITGVQKLSSMATAVTLNLILSLRKFTSLVLSVILLKNRFTFTHWLGSFLVFVGTIWYSIPAQGSKKKKEN